MGAGRRRQRAAAESEGGDERERDVREIENETRGSGGGEQICAGAAYAAVGRGDRER
jgi:hypothetical protein